MLRIFILALKRYFRLWWLALRPGPGAKFSFRRLVVMLGFLPLLGGVQAIHWVGFLLDEILFRAYRRVPIKKPVFILGVPRSGTTHLHEVMANDTQFTSFTLWECLFGLSITARYFWRGVVRVDRLFGGPLAAVTGWIEKRWLGALDDIHPLTLGAPEEDYMALLPMFACFVLVVPFPGAPWLWRMGYVDRDMSTHDRDLLLGFYKRCLQKHLYFHGPEKVLLSKNAAFASLANALARYFDDCRVIVCDRPPAETLPSQLSALSGGVRLFGCDPQYFNQRFLELFEYYYPHLDEVFAELPPARAIRVPIARQRESLGDTLRDIYQQLGLPMSETFRKDITELDARSRNYRSRHRYSAHDFGFSQAFLRERFGDR